MVLPCVEINNRDDIEIAAFSKTNIIQNAIECAKTYSSPLEGQLLPPFIKEKKKALANPPKLLISKLK